MIRVEHAIRSLFKDGPKFEFLDTADRLNVFVMSTLDTKAVQNAFDDSITTRLNMHDQTFVRVEEDLQEGRTRVDANPKHGVLEQNGLEEVPCAKKSIDVNFLTNENINLPKGVAAAKFEQAEHTRWQQSQELMQERANHLMRDNDGVGQGFGMRFICVPNHPAPPR